MVVINHLHPFYTLYNNQCVESYDLLNLDAKVESTFSIGHLEVLTIAAGSSCHRIQLLLRHNHNSPVFCRIEGLEVVNDSACCVLSVAFFAEGTNQELFATLDKVVRHVHLLFDVEKGIRFIWGWNATIWDGTFVQ